MYWYGKGFQFISSKNISRRKLVPVAASSVDNLNFTPFVPFEFCITWIYFFPYQLYWGISYVQLHYIHLKGTILWVLRILYSCENITTIKIQNIYIIPKDYPWHFAVHLSFFPGPSQPLNCFLSLEVSVYLI